MTESSLPAAGWYPAAHAGGESRYWDGTQWADADNDANAADGGVAVTEALTARSTKPSFLARPMSRKTGLIATGAALVVGLLFGGGIGTSAGQSEVSSLKDEVAALESDIGDAEAVAVELDADLIDAVADLDRSRDELTQATGALETATAQLTELQTAATASQTELDARAARITDLEGQLASRSVAAPAPPAAAAPAAPTSAHYENCTAARNAGAAPVRSGDPGYGRHLDRDGDGVGCE